LGVPILFFFADEQFAELADAFAKSRVVGEGMGGGTAENLEQPIESRDFCAQALVLLADGVVPGDCESGGWGKGRWRGRSKSSGVGLVLVDLFF